MLCHLRTDMRGIGLTTEICYINVENERPQDRALWNTELRNQSVWWFLVYLDELLAPREIIKSPVEEFLWKTHWVHFQDDGFKIDSIKRLWVICHYHKSHFSTSHSPDDVVPYAQECCDSRMTLSKPWYSINEQHLVTDKRVYLLKNKSLKGLGQGWEDWYRAIILITLGLIWSSLGWSTLLGWSTYYKVRSFKEKAGIYKRALGSKCLTLSYPSPYRATRRTSE